MIETTELAPGYAISRLIKGGWQLAGGHGAIDRAAAVADMAAYVEAGITTFDCADIYTGVEELIGDYNRAYPSRVRVHTKFVPDLDALATIDRAYVVRAIDRSLRRLGVERLDLVQFHWWDYAIPGCVETALWLQELQRAGKVELLGGTNFDTPTVRAMLDAGVEFATMQVQYSVLDDRPARALTDLARQHGIRLLCYGTVAGGFLSDAWLGRFEPDAAENRSLAKYALIIEDFGGWHLFQELLQALRRVADRHGTDIASVATRAVLDRPQVAAAIVGVRNRNHLAAHKDLFAFTLDAADHATVDAVLSRANPIEGDVYTLERDRAGRHGRIMKYNLSDVHQPQESAP